MGRCLLHGAAKQALTKLLYTVRTRFLKRSWVIELRTAKRKFIENEFGGGL